MELLHLIFTFLQYLLDGAWLSYDFGDRKSLRAKALQYGAISGAVAVAGFVLFFEAMEKILEVLNTPMGSAFLGLGEGVPILGVIATALLSSITLYKLLNILTIEPSHPLYPRKWGNIGLTCLKLLLQLALLSITIALLAFPPTGIALVSACLAVCLVGTCVSAYALYRERQEQSICHAQLSSKDSPLGSPSPNRPKPEHTLVGEASALHPIESGPSNNQVHLSLKDRTDPSSII
jgi:hypothetical protein